MSERHCIRALRCHRRVLASMGSQSNKRSFASSSQCQKHGALPTFAETSSPVLDDLLSTLRSQIFLPSHLLERQRNIIFRKRNKAMLENDTFTAEVGGEKVRLLPIDVTKDIPDTWKSMNKLLELMKDRRDWDNLPTVLEGMHTAKRKFKPYQWEKLIRKASDAGMQQVIVECARRHKTTNMPLREIGVLMKVMWAMRKKPLRSEWQYGEIQKAFTYAEQILQFLDEQEHGTKRRPGDATPRRKPDILGTVLELAAMRAFKRTSGEDFDGKVARYAEAMIPALVFHIPASLIDNDNWQQTEYELQRWIPVRQGLLVARKVLGEEMPQAKEAKDLVERLDQKIDEAAATVYAASNNESTQGLKWLREANENRNAWAI